MTSHVGVSTQMYNHVNNLYQLVGPMYHVGPTSLVIFKWRVNITPGGKLFKNVSNRICCLFDHHWKYGWSLASADTVNHCVSILEKKRTGVMLVTHTHTHTHIHTHTSVLLDNRLTIDIG